MLYRLQHYYSFSSDVEKLRSTYQKLASLHKEFNHQDQVVRCYSAAVMTYDPGDLSDSEASSCSALWMDFSAYIVGREGIPEGCLEMVCMLSTESLCGANKRA